MTLKVLEISLSVSHMSPSSVLVTDLSTAFDTVYHVKFLKKLEWHGINVRTYSKITKTNIFVIEK